MHIAYETEVDILPFLQGLREIINTQGVPLAAGVAGGLTAAQMAAVIPDMLKAKSACLDALRLSRVDREAKLSFKAPCPRCEGTAVDPTTIRDDLGAPVMPVVCKQCKGTKEYLHPWFGKHLQWKAPGWRAKVRDGKLLLEGSWEFEVVT